MAPVPVPARTVRGSLRRALGRPAGALFFVCLLGLVAGAAPPGRHGQPGQQGEHGKHGRGDDECPPVAFCGNGVVDPARGEACDDGGESATCDADCTPPACGDGVINRRAGEFCDDGGESTTCDADCTAAFCGDGTVNPLRLEECDTGGNTATCDADCTVLRCGDGFVNPVTEQCDDGNLVTDDGCSNTCTFSC